MLEGLDPDPPLPDGTPIGPAAVGPAAVPLFPVGNGGAADIVGTEKAESEEAEAESEEAEAESEEAEAESEETEEQPA